MASLAARALIGGSAVVAVSTAALPGITGYGTVLYEAVLLGAWGIVAAITSGKFADQHHGLVWFAALLLNVTTFLLPAVVVFLGGRRRWPKSSAALLLSWAAFYLLGLFVLFPATDGP